MTVMDMRPSELASADEKRAALEAGGVKWDGDKGRFDLIPGKMLMELAQLYTVGARKYNDRNWERGMKYGRCFAAMMRHAWKWWLGEEVDPDTNVHHLIAVIWNAAALHNYVGRGMTDFDDRPLDGLLEGKLKTMLSCEPIKPDEVREALKELKLPRGGRFDCLEDRGSSLARLLLRKFMGRN